MFNAVPFVLFLTFTNFKVDTVLVLIEAILNYTRFKLNNF